MRRQATSRQTDIATELEGWMDLENDNLSEYLFTGLEEVAEKIDDMVNEILGDLQDVRGDNEELKTEIERLINQLEELEESK